MFHHFPIYAVSGGFDMFRWFNEVLEISLSQSSIKYTRFNHEEVRLIWIPLCFLGFYSQTHIYFLILTVFISLNLQTCKFWLSKPIVCTSFVSLFVLLLPFSARLKWTLDSTPAWSRFVRAVWGHPKLCRFCKFMEFCGLKHMITKHFRYLKWRYSPKKAECKAYVRENPPQK